MQVSGNLHRQNGTFCTCIHVDKYFLSFLWISNEQFIAYVRSKFGTDRALAKTAIFFRVYTLREIFPYTHPYTCLL